jgi:hypothetical protein
MRSWGREQRGTTEVRLRRERDAKTHARRTHRRRSLPWGETFLPLNAKRDSSLRRNDDVVLERERIDQVDGSGAAAVGA